MSDIDKMNAQEQVDMLKEIDKAYANVKLPEVEPKYNKDGEITNEKEIKETLKKVLTIVSALWLLNKAITDTKSTKVMTNTILYYNAVKKAKNIPKTMITKKEWTSLIDKISSERAKQIKINQVIRGNARVLNKRIQQTVVSMYKRGKSKPQIAKELQRTMRFNKNKAKSIAMTELNYYKSEAQLQATDGLKIKKTWKHNHALEPRESHQRSDGKTVIGRDTYFVIGGNKTKAPQHFGIASQDINCHCSMIIEVID